MNIAEAAAILNANTHRGNSDWYVHGTDRNTQFVRSRDVFDVLEPFEATAIATAYLATHADRITGDGCCVCSRVTPLFDFGSWTWDTQELRPRTIMVDESPNYGMSESNA